MAAKQKLEVRIAAFASAGLGAAVAFATFVALEQIAGTWLAAMGAAVIAVIAYRAGQALFVRLDAIPLQVRAQAPEEPTTGADIGGGDERGARVVQLFDPAARPTAIDSPVAAPPDASVALREALDQLRRSLRQA